MSANLLEIFKKAKKMRSVPGLLEAVQSEMNDKDVQWHWALDLRDYEFLLACKDWDTFIEAIKVMEPKYKAAWKIIEEPASAEEWRERMSYLEVAPAYWEVCGIEVVFFPEPQEEQVNIRTRRKKEEKVVMYD